MTIFLFSSILSAKQQWQSSTSTRPDWQRQKGVMFRMQSTYHEEAIFDRQHQNGELARLWWPENVQIGTARKCNIKHHGQLYSRRVLPSHAIRQEEDTRPSVKLQDGAAGNDVNQDVGRTFRSPLWWRWKMAALLLPVAILDDLISGFREWGHPRWRPKAERPPFSTTTTMGIEKFPLYYLYGITGNWYPRYTLPWGAAHSCLQRVKCMRDTNVRRLCFGTMEEVNYVFL